MKWGQKDENVRTQKKFELTQNTKELSPYQGLFFLS
jgi:hypothetical protein